MALQKCSITHLKTNDFDTIGNAVVFLSLAQPQCNVSMAHGKHEKKNSLIVSLPFKNTEILLNRLYE